MAWMAEKHAKTCEKCRQVCELEGSSGIWDDSHVVQMFTATNRKHHCRCCGRIFCSECSRNDKIPLSPYKDPVRCCNQCSETQQQLIAQMRERQIRVEKFVAKYLELLETGGHFVDGERSDVERDIKIDGAMGTSLQFRNLIVTETVDVSALADKGFATGVGIAHGLKAATLRGIKTIRGVHKVDGSQIVNAFRPEQAKQNLVGAAATVSGGVVGFAKDTIAMANTIMDGVEGPRVRHIMIKDIIGASDCAGNPVMIKTLNKKAINGFVIMYKDEEGEERELVCIAESVEEKSAWLSALTELKVVADDAGADLLVFKKELDQRNQDIKAKISQRKEMRKHKVMREAGTLPSSPEHDNE